MRVVPDYHSVQSTNSIPLSQMLRPQTTGGKVAVSVADFPVYARYKHITVTPSFSNGVGYSSSRLRVLDVLIDRLVQMKEQTQSEKPPIDISGLDAGALDALIEEYGQRYRALKAQSLEALSERRGTDFGVHDSKNALFLDFTA